MLPKSETREEELNRTEKVHLSSNEYYRKILLVRAHGHGRLHAGDPMFHYAVG